MEREKTQIPKSKSLAQSSPFFPGAGPKKGMSKKRTDGHVYRRTNQRSGSSRISNVTHTQRTDSEGKATATTTNHTTDLAQSKKDPNTGGGREENRIKPEKRMNPPPLVFHPKSKRCKGTEIIIKTFFL